MTEEQMKLVEDNHNLIYWFLKKYKLEIDEWYDMAAIGLCNAARTYDSEKSKFSTYAIYCIFTSVFNVKRKERSASAIPADKLVYYNALIPKSDDESCELMYFIPSSADVEGDTLAQVMYDNFIAGCNERERIILQKLSEDWTQTQIGDYLNLRQPRINKIIKEMRKRFLKEWRR